MARKRLKEREEEKPRAPKEKMPVRRTLRVDEIEARRAAAALARDGKA